MNLGGTLEPRLWSRPVEETRRLVQSALDKAQKAAREAIRLDPRLATGYATLGIIETYRKNWTAAEGLYRQALTLDPNDPDALQFYGGMLARTGRLKEFLRVWEQMLALEPLVPIYTNFTAQAMLVNGQTEIAISMIEARRPNLESFDYENLAPAYAAAGRFSEAADTILAIPKNRYGDSGQSIEEAAQLIRGAPAKTNRPETLPILPVGLNFVYGYVGALDRIMEHPERALEAGLVSVFSFLYEPQLAPVRKTERFKTWIRKMGLVDYWRARGWPDLCRPMGADDFVCD